MDPLTKIDPPGTSVVGAGFGEFNLAANLGGNANSVEGTTKDLVVVAGGSESNPRGFGTAALNLLGNRNDVEVYGGFLNAAIAVGNLFAFPNGSDTTVHVGDFDEDDIANLSVGFNVQPPFITET